MITVEEQAVVDNVTGGNGNLFVAWCDNNGEPITEESLEQFEESFQGVWDSVVDYVAQFVEDTGMLGDMPESLRYYFDYDGYARDMILGGDIFTIPTVSGVAVFTSY
jgi:antirestriction protein